MKLIAACLFSFVLVLSYRADGQARETPAQQIRRLEELERTAVTTGDTTLLFKIWSPDYVVNNPNNMILHAAQIKSYIRNGGIDYTAFTRNIETVTVIKDIAVVMGNERVAPKNKSDNAGKTVTRRYTNVWIKTDTSWQLAARQATNIMVQ